MTGPPPELRHEAGFATEPGACLSEACPGDRPASVLSVLYGETVAERRRALARHAEDIRSAAVVRVDPSAPTGFEGVDAVRVVETPEDLTGVGIAVTDWLAARDPDERPVVCLEGLSTMLQYVETDRAFRYLHEVLGRCRSEGAAVHGHLDPAAHDDTTVARIRQLFDTERRVDAPDAAGADPTGDQAVAADGGPRGDES